MSSKTVALAMSTQGYRQTPDETTQQRHVSWAYRFLYLVGLFVFFTTVWYMIKLESEVTSMKSQLIENTRMINELRDLCRQRNGLADTNTINLGDFEYIGKPKDIEIGEKSFELGLNSKTDQGKVESSEDFVEFYKTDDGSDNTGDGSNKPAGPQLMERFKRNQVETEEEESTPMPGKRKSKRRRSTGGKKNTNSGEGQSSQRPTAKECRRACDKGKVLPEGCNPCTEDNAHDKRNRKGKNEHHKHRVVTAHFVGYTDTVASIDEKNPEMATVAPDQKNLNRVNSSLNDFFITFGDQLNPKLVDVIGGLIPHWNFADWMDESQKEAFTLHASGNVTVHKGGIYFVYSQVQYYDENDFTGHSIVVNGAKFVSCIECPVDSYRKFSTCYIGGVTRLEDNSVVGLNVTSPTKIRLGSDTSYFGLIKLV